MNKYRYHHMYKPVEDWLMSAPAYTDVVYMGMDETLICYGTDVKDTVIYKNVDVATINAIRTQLRQVAGWFTEAQVEEVVVWRFLGVYDEKLQSQ